MVRREERRAEIIVPPSVQKNIVSSDLSSGAQLYNYKSVLQWFFFARETQLFSHFGEMHL